MLELRKLQDSFLYEASNMAPLEFLYGFNQPISLIQSHERHRLLARIDLTDNLSFSFRAQLEDLG